MNARWILFAWHNTLRNRRRSAVTVTIAALGTAAILLAGGFALYTYESLSEASARTSGHLLIAKAAQFDSDEDIPLQHGLDQMDALRTRLLADPAVRQVLPRIDFSGLISNGDKSTVMMAAGIDPDAEFAIKGPFLTMVAGKVMSNGQQQSVMIGEGLARSLKVGPGGSLTLLASTTQGALNAVDVTVEGVFSTGVPELDKRMVYTDILTAQRLLATTKISSLGVFLDRMDATDAAQARLSSVMPGLSVRTWLEQAVFYRSVRDLYNRIFGTLGLIIGVIVVFVVTNAMAMAVIERTREIGTMRALGTMPWQLTRNFALEGMVLGGLGSLMGVGLSLAISMALLIWPVQMPPPPGRSTGYPLQIAVDPLLITVTVVAMITMTMLASAIVARRTVRRPIVHALAHV